MERLHTHTNKYVVMRKGRLIYAEIKKYNVYRWDKRIWKCSTYI